MKKMISIILVSGLLLTGCSSLDTKSPRESGIGSENKDLVWYEIVSNGSKDSLTYNISYMDNNKQKSLNVKGKDIVEHILKNPSKQPYITIKDGEFHIYRQPMNIMYNKEIKGKVKDKEVVSGE